MAGMNAALYHVLSGRTICKRPKIMDEVSLIKVTTGKSDIYPIDLLFAFYETQNSLQSPNSTIQFGS